MHGKDGIPTKRGTLPHDGTHDGTPDALLGIAAALYLLAIPVSIAIVVLKEF